MKLLSIAILAAIAVPSTATADDATDIRRALETQLSALAARDAGAFATTFLPDKRDTPRAVCILPFEDATAAGIETITDRTRRWPSAQWEPFAVTLARDPSIDVAGSAAQVTADLRIELRARAAHATTFRFDARYTALYVLHGVTWRAAAVMISKPYDDKPVSVAFDGYDGVAGKLARFLEQPRVLAGAFDAANPSAVVIGIQSRDRASGADAASILAQWSKRRLVVIGDPDELDGGGWGYAAATLSDRRKKNDNLIIMGLVIARPALTTKRKKGWLVTSAHFAFPQRLPSP